MIAEREWKQSLDSPPAPGIRETEPIWKITLHSNSHKFVHPQAYIRWCIWMRYFIWRSLIFVCCVIQRGRLECYGGDNCLFEVADAASFFCLPLNFLLWWHMTSGVQYDWLDVGLTWSRIISLGSKMFSLNFIPHILSSEFRKIEQRRKYISWILHLVVLVTEFCDLT